jgi:hypothetical protein
MNLLTLAWNCSVAKSKGAFAFQVEIMSAMSYRASSLPFGKADFKSNRGQNRPISRYEVALHLFRMGLLECSVMLLGLLRRSPEGSNTLSTSSLQITMPHAGLI